jgi:AcrR family transcriptional regulator
VRTSTFSVARAEELFALTGVGSGAMADPPVINNGRSPMPRPSDPNARSKLLAAAESVFVARGLDAAKVEEIAAGAGLAKGSFYLHFGSKEDAFRQLVEAMVARLGAQLESLPEDCIAEAESVADFLDRWVEQDVAMFEFVWHNRALMGLMLEGGRCASYRHLVDQFCDGAALKIGRYVAQGIAHGIYRDDLDIDVTAAFMAGAYDRLARQIVREPRRPNLEAMLRKVQFLILRGIGSTSLVGELERLGGKGKRAKRKTKRSRKR